MIGPRLTIERGARDEAEKPFWISYADLMTSLAIVFLIVMVALLVAVVVQSARQVQQQEALAQQQQDLKELAVQGELFEDITREQQQYEEKKNAFERALKEALAPLGISVTNSTIFFGDVAEFDKASSEISEEDQITIRKAVEAILRVYAEQGGDEVLEGIDVEGFASPEGGYFYNLNLSLERSQSLMCVLLTGPKAVPSQLDKAAQDRVAQLFAIGGRSSNDVKGTNSESRRVEMTLRYMPLGGDPEVRSEPSVPWGEIFDYRNPGGCPVTS